MRLLESRFRQWPTTVLASTIRRSADDEMTIKCAYHRNCRLLDNDNYKDLILQRSMTPQSSCFGTSAGCISFPGLAAYIAESGNPKLVFI